MPHNEALQDFTSSENFELGVRPRREEQFPARQSVSDVGRAGGAVIYPAAPRLHLQYAIEAGGRQYVLRGGLVLVHREENGLTVVSSPHLPIEGLGESYGAAVEDFCENFDIQYCGLVQEDGEQLTPGARDVAEALRAAVEAVEQVL